MNGPNPVSASLVTCSFRGDLEVCRLLCDSVDRFVPDGMTHILYVPADDLPLFAGFASPRRILRRQEDLLPRWFWNIPMPGQPWRQRLRLPRRNVYLTPYSLPVRGWIAQQIMKIAAAASAETDIVVHVDSDNAFIRPLTMQHLMQDNRVRLYRNPDKVGMASHRRWHRAASTLLGLADCNFHDAEYIDQLVVWRRSVAQGLTQRLATTAGADWRIALARTPHFAEYILYGVYADKVAGLESAGLFATAQSLCLSRWSEAFSNADDEETFLAAIGPEHVACLIQSTIAMSPEARRSLFERAANRAAV